MKNHISYWVPKMRITSLGFQGEKYLLQPMLPVVSKHFEILRSPACHFMLNSASMKIVKECLHMMVMVFMSHDLFYLRWKRNFTC